MMNHKLLSINYINVIKKFKGRAHSNDASLSLFSDGAKSKRHLSALYFRNSILTHGV